VLPKQTTSSQSIKENLAKSGLASTHTGRVTQSTKPARMIHGTKSRKVRTGQQSTNSQSNDPDVKASQRSTSRTNEIWRYLDPRQLFPEEVLSSG
jgi:hypothetical protein